MQAAFVPGWEMSGTVRTDGAGFRAGDRVAALPVTGGFAQTVAVDASRRRADGPTRTAAVRWPR
ncbi:hypothetical protein [Streptomyces sp. NBC_01314]|uniref:hypothetical protein n=1 Tax=Streptomyces sp. NBC_01314 TaxID=2903821 RepID=UPI003084F946|nr:hypothetical protein OG622_07680 [Streptomyces sp. NBC_01314]